MVSQEHQSEVGLTGHLPLHSHLTGEETEAQQGKVAHAGHTVTGKGPTQIPSFLASTCLFSAKLV